MSFKITVFLSLTLAAAQSFAAQLVLCEIAYEEGNGISTFSGAYHKAGKFTVQDCAREATLMKAKVSSPVTFEFTHFTQTSSIFTPGSGWKLSSKIERDSQTPDDFSYKEF